MSAAIHGFIWVAVFSPVAYLVYALWRDWPRESPSPEEMNRRVQADLRHTPRWWYDKRHPRK